MLQDNAPGMVDIDPETFEVTEVEILTANERHGKQDVMAVDALSLLFIFRMTDGHVVRK